MEIEDVFESSAVNASAPPSTSASQVPRGSLSVHLTSSQSCDTITVPDPEQLPPGIAISPSKKYLLRVIRENLIPSQQHDTSQNDTSESAGQLSSRVTVHNVNVQSLKYQLSAPYSPDGVRQVLEKIRTSIEMGEANRKRSYRFHTRVKRMKKSPSKLRKKRLMNAIRSGNPFVDAECCKRKKCYSLLGDEFVFEEYKKVNLMSPLQAKRYIISLYEPETNMFRLKGNALCAEFVDKVLGCCRAVQSAIKGSEKTQCSAIATSRPRDVNYRTKQWYITSFIMRLAKVYGDFMPNKEEIKLPVFSKTALWKEFSVYWEETVAGFEGPKPSKNYFFRAWKLHSSIVKVHKNHGFTVCSRCEMLFREERNNLRNEDALREIHSLRAQHKVFVMRERESYQMRQSLAEEDPNKYMSIIIDGADQKNYGLPHFYLSTKSDVGHKLKVKVVGGLEHVARGHRHLSLYAMTEEYETGANHVIEVVHRMLQRKKNERHSLPSNLFVQVDNCTRENKNRYFMGYFQSLVHLGVFKFVQISFLPIGHTHADIDQAFSSISTRLNGEDAHTLEELLAELNRCYGGNATAFKLERIANYSGLCETTGCLNDTHHFSEYRYFSFTQRTDELDRSGALTAKCEVKVQDNDQWEAFPSSEGEGFLRFVPHLNATPPTTTKKLPNATEVAKCLDAAEERVKDHGKMETLFELMDKVFTVRNEPFHWDLNTAFELRGDHLPDGEGSIMRNGLSEQVETLIRPRHGFNPDDLLAVKTDEDENTKFWVARVKNVSEVDEQDRAKKVTVRWFIPTGNDPWEAKYTPAFRLLNGERTVYEDEIDTACVLIRFESLTTSNRLRVRDKKAIKQMLDAN